MRQKTRLGCRKIESYGLWIDHFDGHALSTDQYVIFRLFHDLRIEREMVVPELDIFRGKGMTVRPLVAFSQVKGQLGEIRIPFPVFGDVRNNGCQVIQVSNQVDVSDREEIRCSCLGSI